MMTKHWKNKEQYFWTFSSSLHLFRIMYKIYLFFCLFMYYLQGFFFFFISKFIQFFYASMKGIPTHSSCPINHWNIGQNMVSRLACGSTPTYQNSVQLVRLTMKCYPNSTHTLTIWQISLKFWRDCFRCHLSTI